MKSTSIYIIAICSIIFMISCADTKEKETAAKAAQQKSEKAATPTVVAEKAPIINLQDTIELKRTVLCIKDSANNRERMYAKLCTIYNTKLADCIKTNKLKVMGNPIAWHTKQKNAFFFEAGIPVNTAPTKPGKGMYMKNTSNDSVFVAHFFGPSDMAVGAYVALNEKLTDLHKHKTNDIYEVYFGDYFSASATPKDFYKLRTDIILPYK
jgi:effector-binding domain-containing protein